MGLWEARLSDILLYIYLQKNEKKAEPQKKDEKTGPKPAEPAKPFSMRLKGGKVQKNKKKRKQRGLVYLAHIPHGFYEVSSNI